MHLRGHQELSTFLQAYKIDIVILYIINIDILSYYLKLQVVSNPIRSWDFDVPKKFILWNWTVQYTSTKLTDISKNKFRRMQTNLSESYSWIF